MKDLPEITGVLTPVPYKYPISDFSLLRHLKLFQGVFSTVLSSKEFGFTGVIGYLVMF